MERYVHLNWRINENYYVVVGTHNRDVKLQKKLETFFV